MGVWDVFRERGFFQQATDMAALEAKTAEGPLTGYIGFDPTADSFHVGHLIPLMALLHFQREGHRPIALLGVGTAMIGDPTGKNEMRRMLSPEELEGNAQKLRGQLEGLLDFEAGALLANNADWLTGLGYIEFLRDIGPHFSVKRMLTFETFKIRLAEEGAGLSFLEFNYPLLQAYDFLELHRRHGCLLQMGGDDQWANIISGIDLVRRMARKTVFGLTFPLHTTASGAKMGKTEKGAVWLDANKTPPLEYFRYWLNIDDADLAKCLALFTLLPMEEVRRLGELKGAEIREGKRVLAREATALIHGEIEAKQAELSENAIRPGGRIENVSVTATSTLIFKTGPFEIANQGDLKTVKIPGEKIRLVELMKNEGLTKSLGEGRRLVKGGGISINDKKISDPDFFVTAEQAEEGRILLRIGKKRYHLFKVE